MKKIAVVIFTVLMAGVLSFAGCQSNTPSDGGSETYYVVSFDSNGGSAVESQRIPEGGRVIRPAPPERSEYVLNGWYTSLQAADAQDEEGRWNFDEDSVTANITLYAGWTSIDSAAVTTGLVFGLNEEGDGYVVTDYTGEDTHIVIPATHENLPVTAIDGAYGNGVFNGSDIVSVIIPDSVELIGQNAFYGCDYLEEVFVSAGSRLAAIGNNAFSGCDALKSMYIPAGMTTLGNAAFNNCSGLNEFTVSDDNPVFRAENGHLIERASATLIRGVNNSEVPEGVQVIGQAAFRRAGGITQLSIPVSVTEIGNYFIADSTIAAIVYEGTQEQWDAIEKTSMWNYGNRDVTVEYRGDAPVDGGEVLVAYFSATGNTERVAQLLAEALGADIYEIEAAVPYTAADINYTVSNCRANVEQRDATARPAIAGGVENMANYDVVFISHPIWQGIAPRIIQTFLESYDFSAKDVYTFSTSASSSGSRAFSQLQQAYPSINLVENLHFTSSQLSNADARIRNWIEGLGFAGQRMFMPLWALPCEFSTSSKNSINY